MKYCIFLLIMMISLLGIFSDSFADKMTVEIEFNPSSLSYQKYRGYDWISIERGRFVTETGQPALAGVNLPYLLPPTAEVTRITLENQQWIELGNFNILPRQRQLPLGRNIEFVEPDPEYYQQSAMMPADPIMSYSTGCKSGFMISTVIICPFRYNPVSGELEFLISGTLNIDFQSGLHDQIYLSERQYQVFSSDIRNFVENPNQINTYQTTVRENRNEDYEYVIITPTALAGNFDDLISWKTQKGIRAREVTKDWIIQNYSGYDDLEKIREFVKDCHQNHGLIYLVLAGDYDNLGARMVPIHGEGYSENTPCDLYFSDVVPYSSNWDGDGDHQFGEFQQDNCDWYSDVYVGRFPVNTGGEVNVWINKLLTYEQNPPSGYLERSLQGGAGLWPSMNYYGDRVCDSIADNHLPSWWNHAKLYENQGINSGFKDSLNQGYGWCHVAGHGSPDGVFWYSSGSMIHRNDNLTNGMKLGVVHSIACEPGWFDNDECCAEYYFNFANGGAIALMLNARYGFGDPPDMGSSEWLDIWTAQEVFDNHHWNIGRAHGLGKDQIIGGLPGAGGMDEVDHWCSMELNLFGDPETQIYSREPVGMNVNHPAIIHLGSGNFNVNVTDSRAPVENAMCCLTCPEDSSVFFTGLTNANGAAQIPYTVNSVDDIVLIVYAHDHLYYLDTVYVTANGAYVGYAYTDSIEGGYQNGQINSGCIYNVTVAVTNWGNISAYGVQGTLGSSDTNLLITPDTLVFGNINQNDTVIASAPFEIQLIQGINDNYSIPLQLVCWDNNDSTWISYFNLLVKSPELKLQAVGGPDQVLPGDNFELSMAYLNQGSGYGYNLEFTLRTDDPYVTVDDSTGQISQVDPNCSLFVQSPFHLTVSPSCPQPHFVELEVVVQTDGGYCFTDSFTMGVGAVVFAEDFESGDSLWSYSGSSSWHLTTHDSHSSTHSMYCGQENSWEYANNITDSRTYTPQLTVGAGVEMTFWHCYDIETSWDGAQMQMSTDGGSTWTTIETDEGYTGTNNYGYGGYSPGDPIWTGYNHTAWEEQHYTFTSGGDVNICWRFGSDGSVTYEGYYFDDVVIGVQSGFSGVEEEQNGPPGVNTYQFRLAPAYPNPVQGRAIIAYSVGAEGPVSLKVYDLTGREITTLINQVQGPGNYRVEWDGRDNHGTMVSSGTYFYRMVSGNFSDGKKLVVVR